MVLLTYQDESSHRVNALPEKDGKTECPKTAYIDKLYAFNEDYAEEERCDLFFICQDGEIPAHRLVISNASKYIMAMQDDQPPWYPVYISVPDLTKEIVNTLVRLAYTGQMNIPAGITSDELLDAMQALGWVNTDCLTANYLDTSSASADDEFGSSVSSKTAESLETVLKMNFPVSSKGDTDPSDEEMEMALPDIPLSDEDEGKLSIDTEAGKRKVAQKKRTRQTKSSQNPSPSKAKPTTAKKRGQSPKQTVVDSKPSESQSSPRKGARKSNEEAVTTNAVSPNKDSSADVPANPVEADSEPLRSRTRTIRKPKKFDDLIVLTPTKRKDSPTKSPSKPPPKTSKVNETEKETVEVTKTSKKSPVNKKGTIDEGPAPGGSKNRRSTSTESKDSPRNSLITSYFNKRSPRKSNDVVSADSERSADNGKPLEVNSIQSATDKDSDISRKDNIDNAVDKDGIENGNSTISATRKRARSTASTKSDKEAPKLQDATDSDTKSRKRNNNQDNSELEAPDTITPVKRGRKASTMSNASKASNKESTTLENELEDNGGEMPRKRRSRQD